MAHYTFLPVYKASYELLMALFYGGKNCEREYKYTVVERMKNEAISLIVLIYRANSTCRKVEIIQSARDKVEIIRLLTRLLKDLKQIDTARLIHINEKLENVSKQLSGWQRSISREFSGGEAGLARVVPASGRGERAPTNPTIPLARAG